jgi:hypothetical protein
MIMDRINSLPHRALVRSLCLGLLALFGTVILAMVIHPRLAMVTTPQPQAILMLGGGSEREVLTAKLAIEGLAPK